MKLLMISGSRNPEGQTARAADAVLEGAGSRGWQTERVFLPERSVERCRQCEDNGWGLCRKEGRCCIDDDFASIVKQAQEADAVAFATPVYFSDLSESIRAFLDRLRRTCTHEDGPAGIRDKPAVGVCVAGGGGGGAPSCCVSLEKVLSRCGFDLVDMIAVRRQNLEAKIPTLKRVGEWLASAQRTADG
jgi:multimeric flavodoxin WrbA